MLLTAIRAGMREGIGTLLEVGCAAAGGASSPTVRRVTESTRGAVLLACGGAAAAGAELSPLRRSMRFLFSSRSRASSSIAPCADFRLGDRWLRAKSEWRGLHGRMRVPLPPPSPRLDARGPSNLASASYLASNFAAATGVIFLGKLIMSGLQFNFTCLLTAIHYTMTMVVLEILRLFGAYEKRDAPLSPRILLLCALVGGAPALNNLSLRLNSLGFYQVNKLLVTPCIVAMEWACYRIGVPRARGAALLTICLGVGIASVNDLSVSMAGAAASCATLPMNAAYKVLWSRVQKQEGWTTLALMRRVLPLSTAGLLVLASLCDPPGLSSFAWTPRSAGLIVLSSLAAALVNWSGFLVIGACSALTHQVLGQLKACVVILGGWLFFEQVYPLKSVLGALLAAAAICAYTAINVREQDLKRLQAKAADERDERL